MLEFSRLAGAALIVLAVTGPLAYCTAQEEAGKLSLKRACIEVKGDWSGWSGGRCEFPKADAK